jgi:hypothetical protein
MQVAFDTRGADKGAPPLEFATGMNEVPEAVDMAVRLMTPQETSLVRAQPRFAYAGREDRPPVRRARCWRSLLACAVPAAPAGALCVCYHWLAGRPVAGLHVGLLQVSIDPMMSIHAWSCSPCRLKV